MCRLMGVASAGAIDPQLLMRFRTQARQGRDAPGDAGGHVDGWGIVRYQNGAPAYAGRSPLDATTDPAYDRAIDALRGATGVVLAHVRKGSVGSVVTENCHPFVRGRYAFCHNGTVLDVARRGMTDSESLFEDVHALIRDGVAPGKALVEVAQGVQRAGRFTSFTTLLTDGETLWGLRLAGTGAPCDGEVCAPDYYTLGHAQIGNALVVSQEHEFLGTQRWSVVPQGALLEARGPQDVRVSRAL